MRYAALASVFALASVISSHPLIRYGHLWVTHRRITIELIAIQYGSIEFVMNILGLDSETMREKALDILALYSPVVRQ